MHFFWIELKAAFPLIFHGDPTLVSVIEFTLEVAAVATLLASLIGIPLGLVIGLGRFRGRRLAHGLANVSLAMPPAMVGAFLFLLFSVGAPLGSLQLIFTKRVVYVAQTILAVPYTVALTAAAAQALPDGLLAQARMLRAGRLQVAALALREARIGVLAGVIAALAASLSEVAAVVILGGNVYGYNQTLASSALYNINQSNYPGALAVAIVLAVMILVLLGGLGILQQQGSGIRWRFRTAT
jgi:tungstate transport system permease protein